MRIIDTDTIALKISQAISKISVEISPDVICALKQARDKERSDGSRFVLDILLENDAVARRDCVPVCQDTGIAVVFAKLGTDVCLKGPFIGDAINNGVRDAYKTLRKSVLNPITRTNSGDNTPAVIHYELVPGEDIEISVMLKGFGSENMSRLIMLPPSKGIAGVIDAITETAAIANDKPCPPIILGVGIGGTAEKAMLLSKEALLKDLNSVNPVSYLKDIEEESLRRINALKIGAGGLGGDTTCLKVSVLEYPTHIASIPVGITVQCHCSRHITFTI